MYMMCILHEWKRTEHPAQVSSFPELASSVHSVVSYTPLHTVPVLHGETPRRWALAGWDPSAEEGGVVGLGLHTVAD